MTVRRQFVHLLAVVVLHYQYPDGQGQTTSANILVDLSDRTTPENLAIFQGDTVVWENAYTDPLQSFDIRDLSGEWASPILHTGETFARTFTRPAISVYLVGQYSGGDFITGNPASVLVMPLTNSRPAISLVSPPDGFVVECCPWLQAAATNKESGIMTVEFFDRGKLIGAVTNAPYRMQYSGEPDLSIQPPSFVFTARMIDEGGHTIYSEPIHVRQQPGVVFNPIRLASGQTAFFYSSPGPPDCAQASEDLKRWDEILVWLKGVSTVVDLNTTNSAVGFRFYRVVTCF